VKVGLFCLSELQNSKNNKGRQNKTRIKKAILGVSGFDAQVINISRRRLKNVSEDKMKE